MIRYIIPMIAGIALSAPALAQDGYHMHIDGQIYDLRTLSVPPDAGDARAARHARELNEDQNEGIVARGMPHRELLERQSREEVADRARQALVAKGCLRPDETDLSRHDCYVNSNGDWVHRPARDDRGEPQEDIALCRDGTHDTYSFSQHRNGTCSYHGGVQRWDR
jgi:hypothetical protein